MTQVGINYAQALFDLAVAEGVSDRIGQQMEALRKGFAEEPAFLRLLCAPNVAKQERCQLIDACFRGKLHPYVLNFLKLITEKGYARYFDDCCRAYEMLYNKANGILPVCAVTAIPLKQPQLQKLTEKLCGLTGKTVILTNRVDSGCLGGVRLNYDGKQIDSTVKCRLEAVASVLKNTVL